MALLLIIGCAYGAATSARSRRRDLAILRALGSNGRQARAVVHWQASLVAITIGVIGIPVGLILGRSVVGSLTNALGIVPGSNNPLVVVVVVAALLLALVIANALALVPARRASRDRIAQLSADR